MKAVDGRFEVDLHGDFDYRLEAGVCGEKYAESEGVKVPPAIQSAPVKLVLEPR